MKLATWNVNSIRARISQIQEWLEANDPSLLCLQETKVEDEHFPVEEFRKYGYKVSFHGEKSYNGVALISKNKFKDVTKGFDSICNNDETNILNKQSRIITCLIEDIRVVNVYVPNGSDLNSEKFTYKLKWLNLLKSYIELLSTNNESICILGDFNIAPENIDIHSPERFCGSIMASKNERDLLNKITKNKFTDAFRIFEKDSGHWTWWDYRSRGWEADRGWRIDHIYLTNNLLPYVKNCFIDKKIRGNTRPSDHAPVVMEINWPSEEIEDFLF